MKKFLFKSGLFIAFLTFQYLSIAEKVDFDLEVSKKFSKEFPCDITTQVEISNRYGKIEIQTWDRPFVKIDVIATVKAGSKSTAQNKLDEISVKIEKTGNNILGVTDIESSSASWWSGWSSWDKNVSTEINYIIQMPANLRIILENKYGNIYLPDLSGKTSINLKYGNLEGKDINNDLLLDLAYGKATIGEVKNLNGNIKYSDYRGTAASVVTLTSKYSKLYLDNVNNMTAITKYDTYKLGSLKNLTVDGAYDDIQVASLGTGTFNLKYSGVVLNSLGEVLTADISYGSLLIENLKTSLKRINITTSYAPIKIYGNVPSKVEIQGKYFDAKLGSDFIQKSKEVEGSSNHIKGFKISEKTSATITITSKYGDVTMK